MSDNIKQPAQAKGDWWLVIFFLVCVAVLAVSVTFIWRKLGQPKPPAPPSAPAVQPVTPAPAPAPLVVAPIQQPAPPVDLSLSQILSDPEPYFGKLIRTHGTVQFLDTTKATFDLRQGNYVLPVKYHAAKIPDGELTVVGVLRRDENLNAPYLAAQQIEPQ